MKIVDCNYRVTNFGKWCRFLLAMEVRIYFQYLEFRPYADIGTLSTPNKKVKGSALFGLKVDCPLFLLRFYADPYKTT